MTPLIAVDLDSSHSEAGVPLAVKAVVAVLVRSAVISTNKVIASGSMTARAPTALRNSSAVKLVKVSRPEPLETITDVSAPLYEAKTYVSVAEHYSYFASFLLC